MAKIFYKLLLLFLLLFTVDVAISSFLFDGLKRFIGLEVDSDIVFIGHSHTVCAIDAKMIEKVLDNRIAKIAIHGVRTNEQYILAKYYYNYTKTKPAIVVIDVDENTFSTIENNLNSHTRFYPFMDDDGIESYIRESGEKCESVIARKYLKTLRYNNSWVLVRSLKGAFGVFDDKPPAKTIDVEKFSDKKHEVVKFDDDAQALFSEYLGFLSKNGATVILAYYPKLILNVTDKTNYNKVLLQATNYTKKNKNVYLFDCNKYVNNKTDFFFDPTHVNKSGQEFISRQLAKYLARLQPPTNQK